MLLERLAGRARRGRLALRAVLFTVGYLLSPLTFWNDAFVNIPIAYAIAYLASLALGPAMFPVVFLAAYNATNIIGLLLMHIGARGGVSLRARDVAEMIVASILYTLLVTTVFRALGG